MSLLLIIFLFLWNWLLFQEWWVRDWGIHRSNDPDSRQSNSECCSGSLAVLPVLRIETPLGIIQVCTCLGVYVNTEFLCVLSRQDQGMKVPSSASQQWGSYFVDIHKSGGGDEESPKRTWCCHCIHKYSTMAIPSVEHIAGMWKCHVGTLDKSAALMYSLVRQISVVNRTNLFLH